MFEIPQQSPHPCNNLIAKLLKQRIAQQGQRSHTNVSTSHNKLVKEVVLLIHIPQVNHLIWEHKRPAVQHTPKKTPTAWLMLMKDEGPREH